MKFIEINGDSLKVFINIRADGKYDELAQKNPDKLESFNERGRKKFIFRFMCKRPEKLGLCSAQSNKFPTKFIASEKLF